jgi:hypothetical protein
MTLTRKKGLTSTGFRRKQGSPLSSFGPSKPFGRKSGIKAKRKRVTVAEGSKYLAACRGEPCYLHMRGCLGGGETVVPCHSNQARHGKGMGIKAKHEFTVPGCANCHALLDQGPGLRDQKFAVWDIAFEAWVAVRAVKMGIDLTESA